MAEGLLRRLFAHAGVGATVGSAGLLPGGAPATPEAIATMVARRVDIRRHVSRTIDEEMATTTPLVIGMTRQHVREACATYGAPMERTFTLKELVRRGTEVGGRHTGEPVAAWLARMNAGRTAADLMGEHPDDDIADPVGRPRAEYEQTADELEDLLVQLVDQLIGGPPPSAAYAEPARVRRGVARPRDEVASDPSTGYTRR
jgi:protein-tyrosine phosphatase